MTRKSSTILTILFAAAMLLAGCNSMEGDQPADRMPIRLTTGIQPTRTATTQDVQIVSGQDVYCWAKLGDDAYFDAWRLTANGSGGFGSQSSTRYYPEEALTMYLTHGNFQPAVVDEVTALPASLVHQVKTDQRQLADYAKSDLLYYYESGVTASASKQITFTHKLSKIVIQLEDGNSGSDYSAAELAKAEVRLTDINPQITMNLDASGTLPTTVTAGTTTIVPYQESASTPSFEAIIPCNQVKPTTLISVTLNGQTATLNPDAPADAAKFEGGKKYTYTVTVSKTAMTVAVTSITNWTNYSGSTAITNLPAQTPVDVRKNPLWYVAKSNLAAGGTAFSTVGSTSQGYCWFWESAMALGYTANSTGYDGYAVSATPRTVTNGEIGATWHLPTHMEWVSIVPGTAGFDIFDPDHYSGETVITEPACTFGYNNDTKYGKGNTSNPTTPTGTQFKSVWSTYIDDEAVRYAIRFLGTEYCSVWKYQYIDYGTTQGRCVISSRLIDQINENETARLASMLATIQSADFDWSENESIGAVQRVFYATGYQTSVEGATPGGSIPYMYGGWWAATKYDSGRGWRLDANGNGQAYLNVGGSDKGNPRTIRLFRDNPDIMRNPLYFVSEYNLKSDCTFDTQLNSSQGTLSYWNSDATSIMQMGYTYTTDGTSYDGYALPATRKIVSNGASWATWHVPTAMELRGIFPSKITTNNGGANFLSNEEVWPPNTVLTEPACTFGYNCSTKYSNGVSNTGNVGIQYKSYWNSYNSTTKTRYAIRFLGTPYCSVWKYQFLDLNTTSGRLVVSARLIEPIAETDLTALAAKMTEITRSGYNWTQNYANGCVVRTFYACGYGSGTCINTHGLYWTTTEYNASYAWYMCYHDGGGIDLHALDKHAKRSFRLFLDN